jgi:serine phosphatase RsbU (regulator of sigma subunit)
MNKKKLLGLLTSISGVIILILTWINTPTQGLSNTEVLLFTTSLVLMMGGIGIYQIQNSTKIRRRFANISFISVVVVILVGFLLEYLGLPAVSFLSVIGSFYLSFAVIPVIAKNRYEKWRNFTNSMFQIVGLMVFDSLGLVFLLLSVLFKLQYWPGATTLLLLGIALVLATLLLWNKKFEKMFSLQIEARQKLEEKNKEILDSINYAKRIQSAILPPQKRVREYLPDSFILYKPKDIVAGDFYWMETAPLLSSPPNRGEMSEGQRGAVILFAAADCTGHGVPGAMVSVVCNNGLNRSVREHGLIDPGQILDKTREIVIAEFEKSEEDVKDGMDISLCSLKGTTLHWAGANNPLWIINPNRTEWPEGALPFGEGLGGAEYKADKQPIGKYAEPKPFTTHAIQLQQGDTVYIFTDGYQDQFGGEKGKKFKAANFKQLLLSIQHETMERQRVIIDEAFEKWKAGFEQIDDVCVIGVRL